MALDGETPLTLLKKIRETRRLLENLKRDIAEVTGGRDRVHHRN